jgi:hypothetical protein
VSWDDAPNDKIGVTVHDRARTNPGYNLYTNDADEAYLLDLDGNVVHTWRLGGRKRFEHAELLDDGKLATVWLGQSLTVLDWDSNVVWDLPLRIHHEVAVRPDGSFVVPFQEAARTYRERPVKFGGIAEISSSGELVREWSILEHLSELQQYHAPSKLESPKTADEREPAKPYDYYHVNSIQVLPDTPLGRRDSRFAAGNLLVCLRNADLIVILDAADYTVTWHWGTGQVDWPHTPRMLDDGHILIFDNGFHRGFSRILELDPANEEIVWSYEEDPPESFFSDLRGSSQRLENGNTLICDSQRGRAFEVTNDGTIVWEFWNPEIKDGKRKRIYRFTRIPLDRLEGLLPDPD